MKSIKKIQHSLYDNCTITAVDILADVLNIQ